MLFRSATEPTLPAPPKDLIYQVDADYAQNPDKITLSAQPWKGSAENLAAYNEYGKYIYYIASVNESGMPEGTQISISDEVSMEGAAQELTVTNTVPTGDLQITKNIQENGITDTSATGTFYYAVYDEEYNPDADPAPTPVRTGIIEVSSNGTQTVTETGLFYGDYYVYELSGQGGTPIVSGNDGKYQTIGGTVYKVSGSGSSATVSASAATATLNNNKETVSKSADKTWGDGNARNLTIYFKLFYVRRTGDDSDGDGLPDNEEDIEVSGADFKALPPGTTEVEWENLPKYDGEGNEYEYIVKEYIEKEGGELTVNGKQYTNAAPDGYLKMENGLHVENDTSDEYNPKTAYSGHKHWIDNDNELQTRPTSLQVKLFADDVELSGVTPQWTGTDTSEWTYTFSDLPVFAPDGHAINYRVEEGIISGYDPDVPYIRPTSYKMKEEQAPPHKFEPNNSLDIPLVKDTDLAYIGVKKGTTHMVWTQRPIDITEKTKIINDLNSLQGFNNEVTMQNTTFYSGIPGTFIFEDKPMTVSWKSDNKVHITFKQKSQWSLIAWGSYEYEYDSGETSFTNRLHTIIVDAAKAWQNASGETITAPPEGTTVTFDLFVNNMPQNKQVVLNGKTDVTELSEDETEAATQEVNAAAVNANAYESEPWKAYWANLPEYDSAGNKIEYVVKEVSSSAGYENLTPDGVSTGGIITNKLLETEINILKVDKDNTATKLTGAKFILEQYDAGRHQVIKTWPEKEVSAEEGKEGSLKFEGLGIGYYKLSETKSPDGYVLTSEAPEFEITKDEHNNLVITFTNTSMVTYNSDTNSFEVKNEPGAELPHTGGVGTAIFYVLGSILILSSCLLLWRRRKTI